jgi:hypothetical protein
MTTTKVGRLLRSATTGYVFGCPVPEPEVPQFGAYVRAPAQQGQSDVIGLVYNIIIQDDAFVLPMAAADELPQAYILDQRQNRQVPIEVSVLAVGYRSQQQWRYSLPPQPPLTLDEIHACSDAEILGFTERLDYLPLILESKDAPVDPLIAISLLRAAEARPKEDRGYFLRGAGRELARLLGADLPRLERLLKQIRP